MKRLFLVFPLTVSFLALGACSSENRGVTGLFKDAVGAARATGQRIESLRAEVERAAERQDLEVYAKLAKETQEAEGERDSRLRAAATALERLDLPFRQSGLFGVFKVLRIQVTGLDPNEAHLRIEVTFASDWAQYSGFDLFFTDAKGQVLSSGTMYTNAHIGSEPIRLGQTASLFANVPLSSLNGVEGVLVK
jgi:hypothetical protein